MSPDVNVEPYCHRMYDLWIVKLGVGTPVHLLGIESGRYPDIQGVNLYREEWRCNEDPR